MKNKDLLSAIGNARDEYILEAQPETKKKKNRRPAFVSAVAAVLVIAIIGGIWLYPEGGNQGLSPLLKTYAISEPVLPEMAKCPNEEDYMKPDGTIDYIALDEAYDKWLNGKSELRNQYEGYNEGLDGFFGKAMEAILCDAEGENKVFSPLNLYMALGMLAEVTQGNSRKQILDLIGYDDIADFRKQAKAVWSANYCDDGTVKSVMASSIWLNKDIQFRKETLDTLAESYYAASYQGEMGTDEYDKAMQDWVNGHTGNMLDEFSSDLKTDPETVATLFATLYFSAKWSSEFLPENTVKDIFRSPVGDMECEFMKQTLSDTLYYWGDKYTAVSKNLSGAGNMWFILPDEGVSADELLRDEEAMEFMLLDGVRRMGKHCLINLSVPKFDVSAETDLKKTFSDLGITDVFDRTRSDYSPLCDTQEMFLSEAEHAARVKIDETGCTAAAYTALILNGTGGMPPDEVDFVLDRPFIFVVTGGGGLPLFAGVVNQP